MKFLIAPFAATAVLGARSRAKFDIDSYDDGFFGGYAEPQPSIASGEVYRESEDPYTTPLYDVDGHLDEGHHHGDGHDHGRRHSGAYREPEPVYRPEPVYQEPEPVYQRPEPVYSEPARHHDHEPVYREPLHHGSRGAGYDQQYYSPESYGEGVPHGDFWNQVSSFNEWDEIWDQVEYEERIQTEAELMIALEAIREALVDLDYEIDHLEDCIDQNDYAIHDNYEHIHSNDDGIEYNDQEIDDQRYRLKRLQKQCRYCDDRLWEDRDTLVLYCQQFAFAKDMVGACADILTCRGTDLPFRWTYWAGTPAYIAPVAPAAPVYHAPAQHADHGDYAHRPHAGH